jgi:SAM-dependent methyltransferase
VTRDTVWRYNQGFSEFSAAFEALGFAEIHRGAIPFLPERPGLILDVGAGSGRDAAWFAARGWDVVAVEPATSLRAEAARLHPSPGIRWIDDRLPSLSAVHRLGLCFDIIWLSGIWMHVTPEDRPRAMRKLATLLRPGGRLVMTLRHGPSPEDRPMWPVSDHEVERLGLDFGLALRVATQATDDLGGRADVQWQTVVLDLPDDGAGALPLLRGVILKQEKSATYKLALLRCIARIADASPNVAHDGDEHVELPLGLIALYWIRMFKPLVERKLPQLPGERMGFVTDAFTALAPVAAYDLRVGASLSDEAGGALRRALADSAQVIARMPARHLTFANDQPVFPTSYGRLPAGRGKVVLNMEFLWAYGVTRVPSGVWHALRRMSAWIEPMLVAEWVRLTRGFAAGLGRIATADEVMAALQWIEPERDTSFVRSLVSRRLAGGQTVDCVWSGARLGANSFDIDHCLPWSAWPCGDLWNLLPAGKALNRAAKRDLIVSSAVLGAAKPRILTWWESAYLDAPTPVRLRFSEEARTTLPIAAGGLPDLEELFQALDFRRLRLRQETQLGEWPGFTEV